MRPLNDYMNVHNGSIVPENMCKLIAVFGVHQLLFWNLKAVENELSLRTRPLQRKVKGIWYYGVALEILGPVTNEKQLPGHWFAFYVDYAIAVSKAYLT